jgi:hypothetical protein
VSGPSAIIRAVARDYLLRAFIDETGDRGMKPSSSSYFAFSAVICRDANVQRLEGDLDALLADMKRSPGSVLHWSYNMKEHTDRKRAAQLAASLPIRLIYVVVPKASIRKHSQIATSTEMYYNYVARLLLERIGLFTSRYQPEGARQPVCKVTFGRVKGFHPAVLQEYVDKIRRTSNDRCWRYLTPTIDVAGTAQVRPLQWADITAGALDSAIKPDRHGAFEPSYWLPLMPLIDKREGQMLNSGFKVLGDDRCITGLPWWPPEGVLSQ